MSYTVSEFIAASPNILSETEFVVIISDNEDNLDSMVSYMETELSSNGVNVEVFEEGQNFTYYRPNRVDILERRNPPTDFTLKTDIRDGLTYQSAPINWEIIRKRTRTIPYLAIIKVIRDVPQQDINNFGLEAGVIKSLVDINPNTIFRFYDQLYYFVDNEIVYHIATR